jgi:hypothetical protein
MDPRGSRFNFLTEAQIWYNRDPTQEVLSERFENIIVLNDEFYQEVIAHPIPAGIDAVRVFGSAPPAQICSDGRYLRLSPARAVLSATG